MYAYLKRFHSIFLSITIILFILIFYGLTWSQSLEPNSQKDKTATSTENKGTTGSQSGLTTKEIPKEPKRVDQVGQKVGEQIDDITQQASVRIGSWINAKVFAGITWFKLIVCFLMK